MDLAWWQIVLGAVVGLIILVILVIIHELGHAIVARRNGVEVEEFGIGFPPRAKTLGKVRGALVTLNWLPLGGFCKMKGESDDAKGKGTYGAASFWAKTKILFAGVGMNFIAAVLIFTVLAFFGIPKITPNQFAIEGDNHGNKGVVSVYKVVDGSPAASGGLKVGDIITEVAGQSVDMTSQVTDLSKKNAGKDTPITVQRGGGQKQLTIKMNADNAGGKGYLGVQTEQTESATIKATWSAPLVAIVDVAQFMWLTVTGLVGVIGNVFTGLWGLVTASPTANAELAAAGDSVSGPIGILGYIFPSALAAGPTTLLYISGIIALSLTVMNLLPIPGLDRGRWFVTALYKLRHKKLTKDKEETIVSWGMICLFGLIILITVLDVLKMF